MTSPLTFTNLIKYIHDNEIFFDENHRPHNKQECLENCVAIIGGMCPCFCHRHSCHKDGNDDLEVVKCYKNLCSKKCECLFHTFFSPNKKDYKKKQIINFKKVIAIILFV